MRPIMARPATASTRVVPRARAITVSIAAMLSITVFAGVAATPASARVPTIKKAGPPTAVTAIPVNDGSGVSWMAPASDGGSSITGYTVTASGGGKTCVTTGALTCTVTGLTDGRRYTIKVQASNSIGLGKPAKVKVTPSSAQNCSYFGPFANLQSCNLTYANLTNANLTNANLTNANLTYANLTNATLTNATLTNATLTNPTLTNANLTNATLTGVSSGGIIGTPSALPSGWSLIAGYLVGRGANLTNANLTGVDLTNAILSYANLTNANLTNATLTGVSSGGIIGTPSAVPSGWSLIAGYLVGPGANLTNATLTNATLTNANLTNANLTNATLTNANLTNANLTNANLTNATLTGVSSGGIIGTPSALPSGWSLIAGYLAGPGANLPNANLTNADLTGVDPGRRQPGQRQPDRRRPDQRPPDQRQPDRRRPDHRHSYRRFFRRDRRNTVRPSLRLESHCWLPGWSGRRPGQCQPDQRRPDRRRPDQRHPELRQPHQRQPHQHHSYWRFFRRDHRNTVRRSLKLESHRWLPGWSGRRPGRRQPDQRQPDQRRPDGCQPDRRFFRRDHRNTVRPSLRLESHRWLPGWSDRQPDSRQPHQRQPDQRHPDQRQPGRRQPDQRQPD